MKFAKDTWLSKEYTFARMGILSYDKFQHFLGGFLFAIPGARFSVIFWTLWEVKDGFISWTKGHVTTWPIRYNWGGDGFSWRDMVAAWAGALCYVLIRRLICG